MFDPRLTEEYQVAGEPYSKQDASGELAAMTIGASLWGTANQTLERNGALRKRPDRASTAAASPGAAAVSTARAARLRRGSLRGKRPRSRRARLS